jgi:hypothetical protein
MQIWTKEEITKYRQTDNAEIPPLIRDEASGPWRQYLSTDLNKKSHHESEEGHDSKTEWSSVVKYLLIDFSLEFSLQRDKYNANQIHLRFYKIKLESYRINPYLTQKTFPIQRKRTTG